MGSCSALWEIYDHMPAEITQRIQTRDQDTPHLYISYLLYVLIVSLTDSDYM